MIELSQWNADNNTLSSQEINNRHDRNFDLHHQMERMQYDEVISNGTPRSLDAYFEDAYASASRIFPWRYWIMMISLGIANSSDASEILSLSYILSDDQFRDSILHQESSSWKAGMLASAIFLGMLLGGIMAGAIGDNEFVGRRPILLVGLSVNAIAGILSALTQTLEQLTFLRCLAGWGIGATVPPLFTLITELAPPSKRGMFITVCASFWMMGSIFVALTALLVFGHGPWHYSSWRIFAILCTIPSIIGTAMVNAFVPESPRFLALHHRHDKALRTANQVALKLEFSGTLYTVKELQHYYPPVNSTDDDPSTSISWSGSYFGCLVSGICGFFHSASLLYQPSLRQTTWPLTTIWFSLNFGTYGILTWINSIFDEVHLEDVYFNSLLFAAANLPGNLVAAFLMDRVGRTLMLMSSSLAASASLLLFAYFSRGPSHDSLNAAGIVTSACLFQAFSITAWNTIDCMTSERFPTSVRSTGMGICAASGRIGAMIAQFVNGMLLDSPVRLLTVASVSLFLAAITPFLLPQVDYTHGDLEDTVPTDGIVNAEERARLQCIDTRKDGTSHSSTRDECRDNVKSLHLI
jgi:MFS family permease